MNAATVVTRNLRWMLRRIVYWTLPVVILYVVFRQIDLNKFTINIYQTNMWLVLLGISVFPTLMLIGAFRWHILLRQYNHADIRWTYSLKHYWMGLPIGLFVPGSLGWDTYRVVVVGHRFGHYMLNMVAILVEKFMALLACTLLVVVLYPLMSFASPSPLIKQILMVAYLLLVGVVLLIGAVILVQRSTWVRPLVDRIEQQISVMLQKTARKLRLKKTSQLIKVSLRQIVRPLSAPKYMLSVMALSFAIQFVYAVGAQIFFLGANYYLPFVVNLFVTPILFFVFVLPISFGGLGIREAAYIILYGLFGVPPETALLVSFCGFSGLLLNNIIGGLLIFFHRDRVTLSQKHRRSGS